MTDGRPSDDLDLLAAEYALGLLDGAQWAKAHALASADPAFAEQVRQWQSKGAEWLHDIEPVTPPDRIWQGLAPLFDDGAGDNDAIGPAAVGPATFVAANVVPIGNDARKWRSRAYFAAAANVILAVGLGLLLAAPEFLRPTIAGDESGLAPAVEQVSAAQTFAVAQISSGTGERLVTALFDPENRELWLTAGNVPDESKALELWALDASGQPFSLGLILEGDPKRQIDADLAAILVQDRAIAVTMEDKATAPHSAPTGAILGTAQFSFF